MVGRRLKNRGPREEKIVECLDTLVLFLSFVSVSLGPQGLKSRAEKVVWVGVLDEGVRPRLWWDTTSSLDSGVCPRTRITDTVLSPDSR